MGIARGDVTNHSAVTWSKSNTDSIMHVKYDINPNFINPNNPIEYNMLIILQIIVGR
jgi:phosphodiesterase/alkaline phosphatase D-like protein